MRTLLIYASIVIASALPVAAQTNNVTIDGTSFADWNDENTNFDSNDGVNLEYTFQTDYVHPFTKGIKMEAGAKAVILSTPPVDEAFRRTLKARVLAHGTTQAGRGATRLEPQ